MSAVVFPNVQVAVPEFVSVVAPVKVHPPEEVAAAAPVCVKPRVLANVVPFK